MTDNERLDAAEKLDAAARLLSRARKNLKRWAARYAGTDHATVDKREATLVIEAIDEWLLRL